METHIDRKALAAALVAAGIDPAIAMTGRVTFEAVVHRACPECRKPKLVTSTVTDVCTCGAPSVIDDLGIIADSGPRRFLARQLWQISRAWTRLANAFNLNRERTA